MKSLCMIGVTIWLVGCTTNDSYVVNETGPSGRVVPRRVKYTPEELEQRNENLGIPKPPPPPPPDLAEVQILWPQLTDEQKASVLQTVRQMAQPTP